MTQHRLSRATIGLVPRSLSSLIERASAPKTPDTPNVDAVLLSTTASAVRQQIKDINYRESA